MNEKGLNSMKENTQEKINFFKEKQWIMARWFKKHRCVPSERQVMSQWETWWKDDCPNIEDERFQTAYAWIKNTIQTMTLDEIKKRRLDVSRSYAKPVAKGLQEEADKKGYYIAKSSSVKYPHCVSGYAIYKKDGKKLSKKPVYGEKFDLTIKQVCEILGIERGKKNDKRK